MKLFLFVVFLVAVAFGIVAFQNNTEVSVRFIQWDFTEHIAIILGVPFAAGLVAGISMLLPSLWKKGANARHFKKRVHELEGELAKASEPAEQIEMESEPVQDSSETPGEEERKPEDDTKP